MKVKIAKDGKTGTITYDGKTKELIVDFPDPVVVDEVEDYLNTKQVYKIPESQRLDDYREELARPTDNETFLDLALCGMEDVNDVEVTWPKEEQNAKDS
jgi:hypothetical protein